MTPDRALPSTPPAGAAFLEAIRTISHAAFASASALDHDGAFPRAEVDQLAAAGALTAPLPPQHGGRGMAGAELLEVLRLIGHGSLPLGRLYEGHVNALGLVQRYGTPTQLACAARDAGDGLLFGVWNTESSPGLRLERQADGWRLLGAKCFASGAGFVARPLVTAVFEAEQFMVLPSLSPEDQRRADLSNWRAHGMRASATGDFDFTDVTLTDDHIIGCAGDYQRQPGFSGGAWRFAAVQLGGIERLLDEMRGHLTKTARDSDPHQRARLGAAAIAAETARLWVARAALIAERGDDAGQVDAEQVVAYVNLARTAVERAGLDVLELAQRSIGLAAFQRSHPIEHVFRDLATYLRQPAPDKALADAAVHILARPEAAGDLWR